MEITLKCGTAPRQITRLADNEVFVFGSNPDGTHDNYSARYAVKHFGAIVGIGVGRQGQAYAIPTGTSEKRLVAHYVAEFIEYAKLHPDTKFLVAKIGCGGAGHSPQEMGEMFRNAADLPNVYLPQAFIEAIKDTIRKEMSHAVKMWTSGLGNMAKALNGEDPMPRKTVRATSESWKTLPMPKRHQTITLNVDIPTHAMEIVKMGHIPEAMEDHWFMYCDDRTIRYYRSWTGICIFTARYETRGPVTTITTLRINRDKTQYHGTNARKDTALFMALLTEEYGGDASKYWHIALS